MSAITPTCDPLELVFGGGRLDRIVAEADELLLAYRADDGLRYLDHQPLTPPDLLIPEDLAVTILINSRVGPAAFKSVQDHGAELDLGSLPDTSLEEATESERQALADLVATMGRWPGFAASVATKILHKKRPRLIPILDNHAIFGAYMNPAWPETRSSQQSVYTAGENQEALDWIAFDLTRSENAAVWPELEALEPTRSRGGPGGNRSREHEATRQNRP